MGEKPLSGILRERYEGSGKRSCGGASLRRRVHNERSARIDVELDGGDRWSIGPYPENRSRLLTAVECEGANFGFNKAGTWDVLPALLEENAVGDPQIMRHKDGSVKRTYQIEATMEQVELRRDGQNTDPIYNKERRVQLRGRRTIPSAIYTLRRKPGSGVATRRAPRLVAEPPREPPERVAAPLLVPRSVGGRGGKHSRAPLVRTDCVEAAFDVEAAGGIGAKGAYVELDLGADCELSDLATQGRHPPTRTYPQIKHERRWVRRRMLRAPHVEGDDGVAGGASGDRYWVEGFTGWNLARDGQYEGPFWNVLSLGDAMYHRAPLKRHEEELQWVSRYAVEVREERGRAWRPLGIFRGNDDATSEVAHSLHCFKGGIVARYVRFRPLEAVGGGAMRVGVYGRALSVAGVAAARRHGGAVEAGEGPTLVSYDLVQPSPTAHASYVVKGKSVHGGSPRWWGRRGKAGRSEVRTHRKAAASCRAHALDPGF